MGKILIFSAPSGTGKSTIIQFLMKKNLNLQFSISATSRPPRGKETNGIEYFFLTPEDFQQRIRNNEFIEYEEVYPNRFYGTLKSQVEEQLKNHNIVFDIDVKGACNIKRLYKEQALSIFIMPPSIEDLRTRLINRGTETMENIETRLKRAEEELSYARLFDKTIVNDNLEVAEEETYTLVKNFLER